MLFSGLEQLAAVSDFADALREIRQEMRTFREDIDRIKSNMATLPPPQSGKANTQDGTVMMPRSVLRGPTERILPGASWAEKMESLDPILEQEPGNTACIVEVTPRTEACIKASLHSMSNAARRSLQSKFILPKMSSTLMPRLDKVQRNLVPRTPSKRISPLPASRP